MWLNFGLWYKWLSTTFDLWFVYSRIPCQFYGLLKDWLTKNRLPIPGNFWHVFSIFLMIICRISRNFRIIFFPFQILGNYRMQTTYVSVSGMVLYSEQLRIIIPRRDDNHIFARIAKDFNKYHTSQLFVHIFIFSRI